MEESEEKVDSFTKFNFFPLFFLKKLYVMTMFELEDVSF
jgi:hypothetical protein